MLIMSINVTEHYSLSNAINADINAEYPFIIAHERKKKSGLIGRCYILFESFEQFIKNRDKYPHAHEILCMHKNISSNPKCTNENGYSHGRLVFDFDIESKYNGLEYVPDDFHQNVESMIILIIEKYYLDIDILKLKFVWSSCINPKKFSSHLTVKNFCFENWITMMKKFYEIMSIEWNHTYNWISADKLFDHQIIRNNATLRMVNSCKIGGNMLTLNNPKDKFNDSLIRIYIPKKYSKEQIIKHSDHNWDVICKVICDNVVIPTKQIFFDKHILRNTLSVDPVYNSEIYDLAFELIQKIKPNVFKKGRVRGKYLSLLRIKPAECILSNKVHEKENGFLYIKEHYDLEYIVEFGCFRKCSNILNESKYTCSIGKIINHSESGLQAEFEHVFV